MILKKTKGYISYQNGYFQFGKSKRAYHPWLLVMIGVPLYIIFSVIFLFNRASILQNYGNTVKAVVTSERAYEKNGHMSDGPFIYKYKFSDGEEEYTGDSQCNCFRIGDTIAVRYWRIHPSTNQPVWMLQDQTCSDALRK